MKNCEKCGKPIGLHDEGKCPIDADIKMMSRPQCWPTWPLLPLIKGSSAGVMIDSPEVRTSVILCNMFMLPDNPKDAPKEEYASFEAIYNAGWRVD